MLRAFIIFVALAASSNMAVAGDLLQPHSKYSPLEVVEIQLRALQRNDDPAPRHGHRADLGFRASQQSGCHRAAGAVRPDDRKRQLSISPRSCRTHRRTGGRDQRNGLVSGDHRFHRWGEVLAAVACRQSAVRRVCRCLDDNRRLTAAARRQRRLSYSGGDRIAARACFGPKASARLYLSRTDKKASRASSKTGGNAHTPAIGQQLISASKHSTNRCKIDGIRNGIKPCRSQKK